MRPFIIIIVHGLVHRSPDLPDIRESVRLEELPLQDAVHPFRDGVVLGISALGHTDGYAAVLQYVRIFGGGVLDASVGVVYAALFQGSAFQGGQGHLERPYRIARLQTLSHIIADDAAAVHIRDDGEEAEALPDADIRDVADDHLPEMRDLKSLNQIFVKRIRMARICGPAPAPLFAECQPAGVQNVHEGVPPHAVFARIFAAVFVPQLFPAHAGTAFTFPQDKVHDHALFHHAQQRAVIFLVIGLL